MLKTDLTSLLSVTRQVIDDTPDEIVAGIPAERLGTPEDIASILSWAASNASGVATDADFSLNGGLHMG